MPLDYNQRLDELLEDNPYAAEYGIGPAAKPPSFAHLTEPLPPPRPDPTRPSEAGRPSFLHLTEPLPGTEDADPSPEIIDTPSYYGRGDANYLQKGISTAARRLTSGALNVTGGVMQGLARDPLGPIGWIPGLGGLADAAQPEEPIGWLQSAGQWAKDEAASPELAAAPGWEGGWTDTIASAAGSTIPFVATAAIPGGAAVSISSGAILGSYAALDEQVQEAIRQGATPEQIKKASRLASTGGLTEPVPLEIIFNRIPLPGLAKGAVQIAGRLLAKAAAEGGQEAVQTAIQNFSENYVYNPDQDLTEGLAQAFGIGAIVGGGFAVGAEAGGAPAPATAPGAAAGAAAGPPLPGGAPAGTSGVTTPGPGVTTPAGTPPPPPSGGAPGVTTLAPGVTTPVVPAPASVVGGDEDALPDLEPMPEEEEVPAPAPEEALPAAPAVVPEQPELPMGMAPAAPPATPAAPLAPPTPPSIPEQPELPLGPSAAPRTPSQVQRETGVPYAAAAQQAESEGWQAPPAPEAPAPEAKTGFSHLTEPIGTRRVPTTGPAGLQAAGDRVNLKATPDQRRVKNVEVGHWKWQGRQIGVEVPTAGARRSMGLPGMPEWEAQLPEGVAYGRFKRTRSRKAEVKVFIGPSLDAPHAYVIDQIDPDTGKYDEPKTLVGFTSLEEARNAYISSYSDGRGAERLGSISELPVAEFKKWLTSDRTQRPYDRKATAASRRLRQAYTAEAKQTAAAAMEGTDAETATVESEAPGIQDTGEPGRGPGPEYAEPDQAIADQAGTEEQGAQADVGGEQEEGDATSLQPEGEAAPQRVVDFSPGYRTTKIGDTEIRYTVGKDGAAEIDLVKTSKEKRGQGSARNAMQAFLDEADANGVSVRLTADPMEGGVSKARLEKWYKSLGFKPNRGRDKDFTTRAGMIRRAKVQPTEEEHAQAVRSDTGQAVEEDELRPGAGARGQDLQRQASEQPGDGAPLGEEGPQQQEVAPWTETGEWGHTRKAPADIFPEPEKTLRAVNLAGRTKIPQSEADAKVAEWKAVAKRVGKQNDNSNKVILSLFDYTGAWSQPFRDAGFEVIQYDTGFAEDREGYEPGDEKYFDIIQSFPINAIDQMRAAGFEIYGVLSACPCTTFAGSGARWWKDLHDQESPEAIRKVFGDWVDAEAFKSPREFNEALVHATELVIELADPTGFHVMENPIGRIAKVTDLPPPLLRFDPNNFGDPYTKQTQLWGNFNPLLPTANVDPAEGSRIHKLRGDDPAQKRQRSTTPDGFAYAFFMANGPQEQIAAAAKERVTAPQKAAKSPKVAAPKKTPAPAPVPEVAPALDLAARWDKLPLGEKETALAKAKVSRSPITSWNGLGATAQGKLLAAEALKGRSDVQFDVTPPGWESVGPGEVPPAATPEQLQEMRDIINRVAGDVRVEFTGAFAPVSGHAAAQKWGAETVTPSAYTHRQYDPQGNLAHTVMGFALKGKPRNLLLSEAYHESFHAVQDALGQPNAKILRAAIPGLRVQAAKTYGRNRAIGIADSELLAHGYGWWAAGRHQNIHVGLRRYYRAIKEFLRRIAVDWKLANKTGEDVFREIYHGKYRNRPQRELAMFTAEGKLRGPREPNIVSGGYLGAPVSASADTQFAISLGRRRPVRPPDPGATFVEPEETRLRKAERAWAYSAEGMAQIDKALAATGAAIPEQFKLARAELLYSSRAGERGEQLKKQREEPLLAAIAATGRTHEEFDKYLIARHAPAENARLRAMGSTIPDPTGMSDADAAAIMASAHPDFAALAAQVYAISDETLQRQLDSGLISQDVYDEIKLRPGSHNWVTLKGWLDAEGDENIGVGRGFDLRAPEWHMRKGRRSMADSPLAYTLQNAYTAISSSEKNRVAQVLYWMARTFKNDKVWTVDRAKKEKYKYTDPKTGDVEIRERWMPPVRVDVKDTIVVRVKGIPHYISIYNTPLLVAMRNMGAEETNTLLRGMAMVLRTIGKLYTTYSPNFFIVNPIRDLQTAVLQMSEEERKGLVTGTMKKMPASGKAVFQYLNGRARPPGPATTPLQYAHDFAMDGGKVSWIDMKTIEDQKRRLRRAISPNRAQKLWDASRLGTVFETMENLNGAAENAIRLALYTELRQNHKYSRAEAAKVAKEITTNFNRKGTYGPVANSLYMFFNARVQGAVRTGRFVSRVARNPRKHPVAVGALAMLPAMGFIMDMWNYAMGGDDDDGLNRWDHAVPQYEKEKSFVLLLPGGGDKVYKFPLSFGYNAFFVLGQQLSAGLRNQMGLGEGTEPVTAAFNIAHALINATSPVDIVRGGWAGIAPTLLAPAVEMGENKTYRGAPIYPTKYDPKSSDADLAFRSTPRVYREIAKRLESLTKYDKRKPALWDWSPESFQHLANTYLGGAGQFLIDQVAGNSWKILSGKTSEIEVRDIPLARALVGSTSNEFVRQNMYYEAWDQVDYLHRSMTEEGITSEEKKQLKQKYPVEAGVYRDFESAEKRLREQRAKRKKIDNNPRLSSTERQRRLDAVEKKMDDIRTETLGDYAEELKRQRTGATLH